MICPLVFYCVSKSWHGNSFCTTVWPVNDMKKDMALSLFCRFFTNFAQISTFEYE